MKVRIENPTPGGARFTSAHKARFYEMQGSAKLSTNGKRLRFLESHHLKQSAELSALEIADQEYRLSAGGYDGQTRVLTLDEIANLPAIRPVVLATIPKRMRTYSRRSGKVKILVQNGIPVHREPLVLSIELVRKVRKVQKKVEVPKAAA